MKFSAVIFDLGLTLFNFDADFDRTVQRSYNALCRELIALIPNFKPDRKFQARFHEYKMKLYIQRDVDLIETPFETILVDFLTNEGFNASALDLRSALDAMYQVTQEHWVPAEGISTVIDDLKKLGLAVGVISNAADDADVHQILNSAGLLPKLDMILTSSACGWRKPHANIFRHAERRWGIPLTETIMVGNDLSADIGGGNQMGMLTIWTTEFVDGAEKPNTPFQAPDITISKLVDLLPIIRKKIAP